MQSPYINKKFWSCDCKGVTSDKMIFGVDLIWIWSPWLCWRAFRSSKIGITCHLYLLLRLHVFSMVLLPVMRISFLKTSLQANIVASLIAVALVVMVSLVLILWQPTKRTWSCSVFPYEDYSRRALSSFFY